MQTYVYNFTDCKWSDWTKYKECSRSCGTGTQVWHRTELIRSKNGGNACIGEATKSENCNNGACLGMKTHAYDNDILHYLM